MKPSQMLNEVGQSPWLDLIGRKLIHSGELLRFVDEDGIRGVTANPAIFEKAIVETDEYDDELSRLIEAGRTPMEIYETLAIGDVRAGCDVLRPLFDRLGGKDGFVSLEVSPFIARDTRARDRRGGEALLEGGRPRQPVHQDPCEPGRHPGHPRGDRRGDQRQHHPDLLQPRLPAGHRRVHRGPGGPGSEGAAGRADP